MEVYLFRPEEYERHYNCSHMNHSQWTEFATARPILGGICIATGSINIMAYVLCLSVIRKPKFFQYSCFKIMFFLGLLDTTCILFNSFLTGYFHITGTVFCLAPNLQYITGCILVGCWFGECCGCALLAFNRCIDFVLPKYSAFLFDNRRTYLWIVVMYLYVLFAIFFVIPVILNSAAIMWTFDAFLIFPKDVVPVDHGYFVAKTNDYNNYVLIGAMVLSYIVLIVAIGIKGKGTNQSKAQAQVLTVASLICGLNFVPGFTFLLLETIPVTGFLLYFCLFTWQMGNGGGGIILFLFNRSIRFEVLRLFRGYPHRISSTFTTPQMRSNRIATVNNFVK